MILPFSRFSIASLILSATFFVFSLGAEEKTTPDDGAVKPSPEPVADLDFDVDFDAVDLTGAAKSAATPADTADISSTAATVDASASTVPVNAGNLVIDIDSFDFSTTSIQPKENPQGFYDVATDDAGSTVALADTGVSLSGTGISVALSNTGVGSLSGSVVFVSVVPFFDEPGYVKPTMFRMRLPLCLGLLSNSMRVSDSNHSSAGDSLSSGDLGLSSVSAVFSPELTMTWDRQIGRASCRERAKISVVHV